MADRPHGRPLLRRGRRRTGRRRQVPVAAASCRAGRRAVSSTPFMRAAGPLPNHRAGSGPAIRPGPRPGGHQRAECAAGVPIHHPAPPRALRRGRGVTGRYGSPSGRRAKIAALAKPLNATGSVRRSQKKTGTLPAGSVPVNESSLVGANCYAASTLRRPRSHRANWLPRSSSCRLRSSRHHDT